MIDRKNFFHQPIEHTLTKYDDYTTGLARR